MDESDALATAAAEVWPAATELLGEGELESFASEVLVGLRALEAAAQTAREAAAGPDGGAGGADEDTAHEAEEAAAAARRQVAVLFGAHPPLGDRLAAEYRALVTGHERRPTEAPRGSLPYLRSLIVPVLYATDRDDAPGGGGTDGGFGGGRGELRWGKALVGIPDDHRLGATEKPRRWLLRFRSSPERDVVLGGTTELTAEGFGQEARSLLDGSGPRRLLVFVHGYNVGFGAAAVRTAQIAYDLGFTGVPVLYSWPSRGGVLSYEEDANNARWTVPHFQDFLRRTLTGCGADEVHVIAHSMGNRVLTEALAGLDGTALPAGAAQLGNVVLAAPDVDADVFRQVAPALVGQARRTTLYASSRDRALRMSRRLAGYPRAGQSGEGIVVVEGVDTVDATALDTGLMGHSYIGDHSSILSDVHAVLHHGTPPAGRFGLTAVEHRDGAYWEFLPRRR
ncbi:alpha/beta hydrolase [Streptomyces zhihengii]|uniref:alpha/beta hydrolase n=1 Tax=Streptomyces zhihengii TaxID=1818004 RepID=UPI0036B78528